jgi:hypothetical protein
LERIDERLNQNFLVGRAAENLASGSVAFARGYTLWQAALAVIPRAIWLDKPVRAGSPQLVSHYTGIHFAEGTSVGIGQVMELYINFGMIGIVIGFVCIGTLVRWVDAYAAEKLFIGDWGRFVAWFLPSISILQAGGSFVEVTGSAAASIVLVTTLRKLELLRPPTQGTDLPSVVGPAKAFILPPSPAGRPVRRNPYSPQGNR